MGFLSRKRRGVSAAPPTLPEDDRDNGSASTHETEDLMGHGWRPDAPVRQAAPRDLPDSGGESWRDETAVRRHGQRVEIRGRVYDIGEASDGGRRIFQFRVDAYDKEGQRLSFPVELHGHRFLGLLNEGDLVQFTAKARPGEALRIRHLRNLTARGTFRVRGATLSEKAKLVAGIPGFIIITILQIAFFIGFMWFLGAIVLLILEG